MSNLDPKSKNCINHENKNILIILLRVASFFSTSNFAQGINGQKTSEISLFFMYNDMHAKIDKPARNWPTLPTVLRKTHSICFDGCIGR